MALRSTVTLTCTERPDMKRRTRRAQLRSLRDNKSYGRCHKAYSKREAGKSRRRLGKALCKDPEA